MAKKDWGKVSGAAPRNRVNVTATFDIPKSEYNHFRDFVRRYMSALEQHMGADIAMEYLALDQTARDTLVAE